MLLTRVSISNMASDKKKAASQSEAMLENGRSLAAILTEKLELINYRQRRDFCLMCGLKDIIFLFLFRWILRKLLYPPRGCARA